MGRIEVTTKANCLILGTFFDICRVSAHLFVVLFQCSKILTSL